MILYLAIIMEISVVYTDENQVVKKVKALTSVVGE